MHCRANGGQLFSIGKTLWGDLDVAAQTISNYDAINETTTTALLQTVPNFGSDGLTLEQKRAKSIEITKVAHQSFASKGAKGVDFQDLHNGMNNAAFSFEGPTYLFREQHGIPKGKTPRAYAHPEQQDSIIMMTHIGKSYYDRIVLSPEEAKAEALRSFNVFATELRRAGISTKPLLLTPIVPDRSFPQTKN